MAVVEDMLKGNLMTAAAVGATALVLPKVLPEIPKPLRGVAKSMISLFLQSESEAEGGLVDRMADSALKDTLKELSAPGDAHDRQQAAHDVVEKFKVTARTRAARYGHDEADKSARYHRHIESLRRAVAQEQSRDPLRHPGLSAVMSKLDVDDPFVT